MSKWADIFFEKRLSMKIPLKHNWLLAVNVLLKIQDDGVCLPYDLDLDPNTHIDDILMVVDEIIQDLKLHNDVLSVLVCMIAIWDRIPHKVSPLSYRAFLCQVASLSCKMLFDDYRLDASLFHSRNLSISANQYRHNERFTLHFINYRTYVSAEELDIIIHTLADYHDSCEMIQEIPHSQVQIPPLFPFLCPRGSKRMFEVV
ncbi:MAG: hypothetical protein CMB67_04440 [Euryarchaeota archaeon]|nr:hypothetical protein [Euryarchaeota archaeon]